MPARNFEICIDANDPAVLRPFWRTALGYEDEQTAEGAVDLVDPALGGTVIATYPRFTTLAAPEGNELCVTTQ